jgi:arginase family enzyme
MRLAPIDDVSILQGFRVVTARQCYYKSLEPLMAEVRQQMGDGPVYISFDIDALDPCYAPGTGLSQN